ncbi:MAG: UDP-3-O-acyl-N-acetylglucosamine deacetylase, partial [Alphaproteobacteria bacterium]
MLGEMRIAPQRTLRDAVGCRGIGLHSGQPAAMTLRPAAPDTGIVFRRSDAGAEIRADWRNSVASALSTVLANRDGTQVATVEHLLAALSGNRIDNAIVELDGPEVPVMDGSAAPFVRMIGSAGTKTQDAQRRAIEIMKPVEVIEGDSSAALLPSSEFSMSVDIEFDNPLIGHQHISLSIGPGA